MAAHSYKIPDIDDNEDDEGETPSYFSKRLKIESSSAANEPGPSFPKSALPKESPNKSFRTEENKTSTVSLSFSEPTPIQRTGSTTSSSSLLVHPRQRGNPLLKFLRQVKWEFSDAILGNADYSMSRSSCALFLSLRYHQMNPSYIYDRLKANKLPYQLRILLVQCDLTDAAQSLRELARLAMIYDLTLLVSWNDEESARYLETYKIMEGKSAENLMDLQQHQSSDYLTKFADTVTQVKSVNKTDAQTLLHAFGSLKTILNSSSEQLCVCPGLGALKAQRLHQAFNQPFRRHKQSLRARAQEKNIDETHFDNERIDLLNVEEEL